MTVVYVACDHGARAALEPLFARVAGKTIFGSTQADEQYWQSTLGDAKLLICGTSDTDSGRSVESAARRAACKRGIPVLVIEDFPGNYSPVPGGEPGVVFLESEFSAGLAHAKEPLLRAQVCPSVRYDGLRRRLPELRRARENSVDAVLWIGQPETRDSLETLKRLLPALERRGNAVWFRAHPRDAGYAGGEYAQLLGRSSKAIEDLTPLSLDECLRRRPCLVITQFSSVAIEAGFWGIPSLNVLFTDVGGRTLATKKGYSVPPWCEAGAAFLISRPQEVDQVLARALGSAEARRGVMEVFDRYFRVSEEGAPILINLLYNQGLL